MEATVKVDTTRFGELEVNKKDIITFAEGLLGFEQLKKFFIVDPGDQTLILWLQSIDDASTAFPIIEPKIFMPDYSIKLLPAELSSLKLEGLSEASVYTVLTIPQTVTDMSANLKAPIIINNQTKNARQIVLQDSKLEVRHKMYTDLKKYIVAYTSDDSKRTNVTLSEDTTESTGAEAGQTSTPVQKAPQKQIH
jgi:flagellar assembly factor FliW